jgi:uncharacterized membrane protein
LEEMTVMMFGYGGTGGSWPVWAVAFAWIGMLAFLGVLAWAGYALITDAARRRRRGADACEILNERLACGEIDAIEYQRLRGLIALGDDHTPADSARR